MKHLIVGSSFTDPCWNPEVAPWSVEYAKTHPSYIVAKAGMGIRGICTEALYWLKTLNDVNKVIILVPPVWRLDIEMDQDSYLCNAMIDLIEASNGSFIVKQPAVRKWIMSCGIGTYKKNTEEAGIFDRLYRHQGFLVLAKENFRALQCLLDYCKVHEIEYFISSDRDPVEGLVGLEYMRKEFNEILKEVEYENWFRFDNKFIDKFLGHTSHPSPEEHKLLAQYIIDIT